MRRERASVGQCDHENERGKSADPDPDPLLTGQAGGLELLEILRKLVQILGRHLRETVVDLFLAEAIGREDGRNLLIRRYVADDGQIGFTRIETLIRRGLGRDRTRERGNRRERDEKGQNEEDGFGQTLGHEQTSFVYPVPLPATRRIEGFGNFTVGSRTRA
jgi:hypothetical protein